jgi:6-phosphofructokinase 1
LGTCSAAVDLAAAGRFGEMAALRGNEVVGVPLSEACAGVRSVDPALLDVARTFFG